VTEREDRRQVLSGGLVVAAALAVMNVASYAFTVVAAHRLGPNGYGAFAAMMGLVLVSNVASLGLQATAARRVAADPSHREAVEAVTRSTARRAAVVLGVLCMAASPFVAAVLHLDTWLTAALLAVPAAAYVVMGGSAGLLQGEGRWGWYAGVFSAFGLARLGCGLVTVLVWPTPLGAMTGVALGSVVPVVVGWWALRHPGARAAHDPGPAVVVSSGEVLREAMTSCTTLLAFFALTSLDVLLARVVLPPHQAGLYAAGAILAKAVMFLPYVLTVMAFPAMARQGAHRYLHLWGLAAVLGVGLVVMAGVALLPGLALQFVGGAAYAQLEGTLWAFAGLGAVLAGIQLLVYSDIARRHRRAMWFVWGAFALIAAGLTAVHTASQMLALVLGVDLVLLVVLAVVATLGTTRSGSADAGAGADDPALTLTELPGAPHLPEETTPGA
jgi:O-antigen/teichoic acid export membrane protein